MISKTDKETIVSRHLLTKKLVLTDSICIID